MLRHFIIHEDAPALSSHIPSKGEQMVRYYGYYSNVSRGRRKKAGQDGLVPLHERITPGKARAAPLLWGALPFASLRASREQLLEAVPPFLRDKERLSLFENYFLKSGLLFSRNAPIPSFAASVQAISAFPLYPI